MRNYKFIRLLKILIAQPSEVNVIDGFERTAHQILFQIVFHCFRFKDVGKLLKESHGNFNAVVAEHLRRL